MGEGWIVTISGRGDNRLAVPAATTQPTPAAISTGKPSIAIPPSVNMSGDTEQEFLADGMSEDITTALSRVRSFFVIARNSVYL